MIGTVFLLALGACTGDGDDPATTCNEGNEACSPGSCGGEGAQMLPGANCNACHAEGADREAADETGTFTVSGTVFSDLDGSAAQRGASIRITDASGAELVLTANAAGNFFSTASLQFPISAQVVTAAGERAMATSVMTGACNDCHRCGGAAGGKLFAP